VVEAALAAGRTETRPWRLPAMLRTGLSTIPHHRECTTTPWPDPGVLPCCNEFGGSAHGPSPAEVLAGRL